MWQIGKIRIIAMAREIGLVENVVNLFDDCFVIQWHVAPGG
jgi:hypothetical protein